MNDPKIIKNDYNEKRDNCNSSNIFHEKVIENSNNCSIYTSTTRTSPSNFQQECNYPTVLQTTKSHPNESHMAMHFTLDTLIGALYSPILNYLLVLIQHRLIYT
uniref:Uncharacterized protein n=1 Tax=Glossina pallidipes TaxID=7398 RepID=A0A1A9ZW84_GLOPL